MKNNFIEIKCNDCTLCCHHNLFVGKSLSLAELEALFFFNERLCDVFFSKKDNLYRIDKTCQKYSNKKCTIHNSQEYPMICVVYPLVFVYDNRHCYVAVDKICPQWKQTIKEVKNNRELEKKLLKIIKVYDKIEKLDVFEYKRMKECGYKLKKIKKLEEIALS